jgi:sulfate adenylyltransferase subunit 1
VAAKAQASVDASTRDSASRRLAEPPATSVTKWRASAGHSAGIVLDREVDLSRGDWLLAGQSSLQPSKQLDVTVAWLDDEPLVAGRVYWALHGHQWVKAKVASISGRLDIHSLEILPASELPANAIGRVQLSFQQPLLTLPYGRSRTLGSMVLVDTASHKTSAAVMVQG